MPAWKVLLICALACVCLALAMATVAVPIAQDGGQRWAWLGGLLGHGLRPPGRTVGFGPAGPGDDPGRACGDDRSRPRRSVGATAMCAARIGTPRGLSPADDAGPRSKQRPLVSFERRTALKDLWLCLDHDLYFAGPSTTWDGPVAFVTLARANHSRRVLARAYLLTKPELNRVIAAETADDVVEWPLALDAVPTGSWAPRAVRTRYCSST